MSTTKDELIRMAAERYPKGTKFLSMDTPKFQKVIVSTGNFNCHLETGDIWMLSNSNRDLDYYVHHNDQWASYPKPIAGDNPGSC
jgi:hypothetical protein